MTKLPIDALKAAPKNPRTIDDDSLAGLGYSMEQFGDLSGLVWNERTGQLVAGHQRMKALRAAGATEWERNGTAGQVTDPRTGERFPVRIVDWDDATEMLANIAANNPELQGDFSPDLLAELRGLEKDERFASLRLAELVDQATAELGKTNAHASAGSLAEKFGVPPFSILDARQGYWQDRKRAWLAIGIQSEIGRGASPGGSPRPAAKLGTDGRTVRGTGNGKRLATTFGTAGNIAQGRFNGETASLKGGKTYGMTNHPYHDAAGSDAMQTGTSIFDPVLCELLYTWFTPKHGTILDPFAGGSVRGVVASWLGRKYVGVDLSGRQIEANKQQAKDIAKKHKAVGRAIPIWHVGDSRKVVTKLGVAADFVFSCPPYADLEVYSDDPADISTMPYADFLTAYRAILAAAIGKLRDNRFAALVVGEVRDKHGMNRGFVPDTIAAMEAAGAKFYNEAILVTAVGSLSIRAGKQMQASRKLGKTHQNVLVFVKGDPKKAAQACGKVEIMDPAAMFGTTSDADDAAAADD